MADHLGYSSIAHLRCPNVRQTKCRSLPEVDPLPRRRASLSKSKQSDIQARSLGRVAVEEDGRLFNKDDRNHGFSLIVLSRFWTTSCLGLASVATGISAVMLILTSHLCCVERNLTVSIL